MELVALRGKELVVFLLLSRAAARLEDLVVPSDVSALYEAGLTTGQDMFESRWSWAEGTDWVLAIPLVEVFLEMGAHHRWL